jgi:hypothetical protein
VPAVTVTIAAAVTVAAAVTIAAIRMPPSALITMIVMTMAVPWPETKVE